MCLLGTPFSSPVSVEAGHGCAERGHGCTGMPRGQDPEGPGHGGTKGRAAALSTVGFASTVLARVVLPFGCSLFSRAGLPAPLCGHSPQLMGETSKTGWEAIENAAPLNCCGWHASGLALSDGHVQCRR